MTTGEDEVADDLLVPVDDKVAAKRGGLFAVLDEIGRGEVSEVAPDRLSEVLESKLSDSNGGVVKLTRTMTGSIPQSLNASYSLDVPSSFVTVQRICTVRRERYDVSLSLACTCLSTRIST